MSPSVHGSELAFQQEKASGGAFMDFARHMPAIPVSELFIL